MPVFWSRRVLRVVRYTCYGALFFTPLYLLCSFFLLGDFDNDAAHVYTPVKPASDVIVEKSSYDWGSLEHRYPPSSLIPLPDGKPRSFPRVQFQFPPQARADNAQLRSRQQAVRDTFEKSWRNYKRYAWKSDELAPVTGGKKNTFGGWAATIFDSLDTLWIMGFEDEFKEAVRAVATVDWENTADTSCNLFETTIRHLGGLLSAYDLSQEPSLLEKAVELGDMLYAAFDTPNRMPPFWLDFQDAKTGRLVSDTSIPSASPCSLSLEFTRLSQITGDSKYYDAISRVTAMLQRHQQSTKLPGMWPVMLNLRAETLHGDDTFTLGALSDSLYEYLLKMTPLTGGLDTVYEKLYKSSMDVVREHLVFRPMVPDNSDIRLTGTVRVGKDGAILDPEGQHLACFAGGMFALGGKLFGFPDDVDLGAKLTRGCMYAYKAFPTGIMPESFKMLPCKSSDDCEWDESRWLAEGDKRLRLPRGFTETRDRFYILRPEAIESVFILYRITGRKEFQDVAWEMFESIRKATETQYGNSAIENVNTDGPTTKRDSMESFWLGETLKYFYLIFSPPDLISLDEYVFNTEAHPLKRPR